MADSDSSFIGHEPCPKCGSSDALARYSDGHGFCFACEAHFQGDEAKPRKGGKKMAGDILSIEDYEGEFRTLAKRGISEETCRKFDYRVGKYKGKTVQVANYRNQDGDLIAQKIRFPDKEFVAKGNMKEAPLYGRNLWNPQNSGKMIVITEGEIDALSVAEVQKCKWPVVSLPNGAQSAKKCIAANIEYLESFESVVLMFDMDEPGQKAAKECAEIFSPGKCKIASLPLKDANECLTEGKGQDIIQAIWNARTYRPDGLVSIDEIMEEAEKPIEWGLPWCFDFLTKESYGRRWGELYALGAGTGVGKTDFFTQQIAYDVEVLGLNVGLLFLEQKPVETAKRVAGKLAGKRFHVPDAGWTQEELKETLLKMKGKVTFYDNFGQTDWEIVSAKIRYMAVSQGIKLIYLDHLTAMADTANEKESLEQLMKEMAGLANELGIIIHFISHLSTPDGKPHEEGGHVSIRHFKGSRAIGFWSYFMFGLERNQQAEDELERQTTTFRILKDRYTGQATGKTFPLFYDVATGRLTTEVHEFSDETTGGGEFVGAGDF